MASPFTSTFYWWGRSNGQAVRHILGSRIGVKCHTPRAQRTPGFSLCWGARFTPRIPSAYKSLGSPRYYWQQPWRAGGSQTRKLMAELPQLQFPFMSRPGTTVVGLVLIISALVSGAVVYYRYQFDQAWRYPVSVRKKLREAILYHKHAQHLDYARAITAYQEALEELQKEPNFPPDDDYVTGIMIELADALDKAQRWSEAIAVDRDLLSRWVGTWGLGHPVQVGELLARGQWSPLLVSGEESEQPPSSLVHLGDVQELRTRLLKAVGTSRHLGSMLEKVCHQAISPDTQRPIEDQNPATTNHIEEQGKSDGILKACQQAYEWSVQVVLVAYGYAYKHRSSKTSSLPTIPNSKQDLTQTTNSNSPKTNHSIFANLPVVPMDARELPTWLRPEDLGGCLEALALFYSTLGQQPTVAFTLFAGIVELIGAHDPCHASVLMGHNAQILANRGTNHVRAAMHWLDHALAVATQYRQQNPECMDNCLACWYSYGVLHERQGNLDEARKFYKRTQYLANEVNAVETKRRATAALAQLGAQKSSGEE
ncbi:hypothetical protein IWQ62_003547 [Dispira parvispora]|uniref:Uncharacterized protein n=1 Tax=Dispira parvispora TaxID=1520584 RepID=A0A9W8AUM2_9FUNG|nr:hypothetical protein IWQ62_003547 [Dispira parvispora]